MLADMFFELRKFARKFAVCFEHFTQSDEGTHDGDVYFHGARTP